MRYKLRYLWFVWLPRKIFSWRTGIIIADGTTEFLGENTESPHEFEPTGKSANEIKSRLS